jgi:DNA polymerase-3 subunit alpha
VCVAEVLLPGEFLAACMSTVEKARIPEFIREARRMGIPVLPPDINESGKGFKVVNTGWYDTAIRYGLDAIKGIGDKAVEAVMVGQPYRSMTDFYNRKGAKCNTGHVLLLARIGAFDSIYPRRKALVREILYENSGDAARCIFKNESVTDAPNNLPCTFDWSLEEPEIGRSGKPLKQKLVPKRCTRACRQYSPPSELDPAATPDYTDEDIREIESTMLGAYVTSTPFDRIDPEHLKLLLTADQLAEAPPDLHLVAGIVNSVRKHIDKRGNEMAFLSMMVQTGDVDVVVFSRTWAKYSHKIIDGVLCLAELDKQHRNDEDSYILSSYMPL